MAKIEFPDFLKLLLEESEFQAPIRDLADRVGEILTDNKLPFFPNYTDHGIDHVNSVLKSEVELIPKQVWKSSKKDSDPRLLYAADAVVIIGATLLHDIAMHLQPKGFLELIGKDSRFEPLPWFKEGHEGVPVDRSWHQLWEDFLREARRFSERQLTNIIGEQSARTWKFHILPGDTGAWERNHNLIIGEFIRRHHARLAHEIAIYGFPGLLVGFGEGQFPAMGNKEQGPKLKQLADLIGLTARSHGLSLRTCKEYLESSPRYQGTPRPMGTAVLYPMALLRVADYLQIDCQRAPAVLLQLRDPQNPISVQEWKKHRAVQQISPANDPRGKMVTVNTELSLSLYLQLRDLLTGLQEEIDHSTAVLDEVYGIRTDLGLDQLNLAIRRVQSNLESSAFRSNLPYVPERTGFTADPNLLTLLVEPLYGKQPSVGVRELMQNAADAVCELEAWCETHKMPIESLDLPVLDCDCDVLIEFIKREDGTWFLRVQDRGIGMTSDTIQNYFLRAGGSFRHSTEWAQEFLDEKGQPRVACAGRFGIGAFAVFLLGSSFRLWTRHVSVDKFSGFTIEASANSQLIEIRRADNLPVGTTIEVEVSRDSVETLGLEEENTSSTEDQLDWYCWDWPKVVKRIVRGAESELLKQKYTASIRKSESLPLEWFVIHPEGFDAVYWTFGQAPTISCNGLRISRSGGYEPSHADFEWPEEKTIHSPRIAVLDSAANLPLTIQRYELSQETVPFIEELTRDVMLSFIAHMLVCGPMSRKEALSVNYQHPLQWNPLSVNYQHPLQWNPLYVTLYHDGFDEPSPFAHGLLRYCVASTEMVPADPWLYSLLNTKLCIVYGLFGRERFSPKNVDLINMLEQTEMNGGVVLPWHLGMISDNHDENILEVATVLNALTELTNKGIETLGHDVEASHVLVSIREESWVRANFGSKSHIWQEIGRSNSQRHWVEAINGSLYSHISLQSALEVMENGFSLDRRDNPDMLYIAEIKTKYIKRTPESLLAKIWNECLGARAVPFDDVARKALIDEGCKHPELKRHINAWQKIKRTGYNYQKR
jgi:hypothetical protein